MDENNLAKILFTADELQLINNSEIIYKKRIVLEKIFKLLEQFESEEKKMLNQFLNTLPAAAFSINGKISRGENYNELPYLILDYPRLFDKENIFAFRTLFWWGNFFSFNIQLSGNYLKNIKPYLPNILTQLKSEDFFVCINMDEWQHDYKTENFQLLQDVCKTEGGINNILSHPFLKLSRKISIENNTQLVDFGLKTYELFLNAWSGNIKHQ